MLYQASDSGPRVPSERRERPLALANKRKIKEKQKFTAAINKEPKAAVNCFSLFFLFPFSHPFQPSVNCI